MGGFEGRKVKVIYLKYNLKSSYPKEKKKYCYTTFSTFDTNVFLFSSKIH